ncbi:MAG TPA: hypothetical protein VNO70_11125 [Blastocatellia bacterium]|nr:hypothetical protein [Blastocatellia bacterium]
MRLQVNLSNRPFTNHRLFWAGVAIVFLLGLYLWLWVSAEKANVMAQAERIQNSLDAQKSQVEQIREEMARRKQEDERVVLTEEDTSQLAAARQLILRKSFSWNRLISDIERFVPQNVRVASIRLQGVADESQGPLVMVEIEALGKTAAQMTEMLTSLEKSGGLFTTDQAEQGAVDEANEVPFKLSLTYRPGRGGAQ